MSKTAYKKKTIPKESWSRNFFDWCIEHKREDLLSEWDYEKNDIGPESTSFGSNIKVWWKCKSGHPSWKASPNNRANHHTGCPYCAGRKVLAGDNDLATKYPHIAAEWNYEKNGELKPTQVTAHSNRKVWWKCEFGHDYQARINARTVEHIGCSKCSKERRSSFPEKAILFYLKKVFPDVRENVSFSWLGKKEVDIFIPSLNSAVEYDGYHWHKDTEKDRKKDETCLEHGINLYRVREEECPDYQSQSTKIYFGEKHEIKTLDQAISQLINILFGEWKEPIDVEKDYLSILKDYVTSIKKNSLAVTRPDLASEWDYEMNGEILPEHISQFSNKKVAWKCPKCGQSYRMMVNSRTGSKHSGCPYCAKKIIKKGLNDFGTEHPDLLAEWDYENNQISPFSIASGSHKKVRWKCKNGHSYETAVYVRALMGCGCPICAHQKTDGSNSFGMLHPELLNEWDYDKNATSPFELLPASNKKVWWKCKKCGYEFQQTLAARTRDHKGCPLCAHQVLVPGINDLATQFPEVAKEWNYERNDLKPSEISGGTNKKYWWKCKKCGFEWECVVASRTKRHSKCPKCFPRKNAKKTDRS